MQMKFTDKPLVVPAGGGLGAEIRGVDLRRLGDTVLWIDRVAVIGRRPIVLHASRPAVQGKPIVMGAASTAKRRAWRRLRAHTQGHRVKTRCFEKYCPSRATSEIRNEAHTMIFIGTAGWSVPRRSSRHFAREGSHLLRYAQRLNCAEINSSFYRSHAIETYQRWASTVPPTFKFAVKIPKAISHDARLRRARVPLRQFLGEVRGLGTHLGPLLIQLPPSFTFDAQVTRRFCTLLRELHRGPVVIEPRHLSWFAAKATDLLNTYRLSRVAADPAPIADGTLLGCAQDALQYYRLHGSPRMYWSNYSRAYLRELAAAVEGAKSTVWIIFDNTAAGYGTANALQLRALLNAPERHRFVSRKARHII